MHKTVLALAALALAGCSLTPDERVALGAAGSELAMGAIEKLAEVGKSPVAVSQSTHDIMAYGCEMYADRQDVFRPLFAVFLLRVQASENPVTADEVLGHIGTACRILDQLPIKAEDAPEAVPVPAPSPVGA